MYDTYRISAYLTYEEGQTICIQTHSMLETSCIYQLAEFFSLVFIQISVSNKIDSWYYSNIVVHALIYKLYAFSFQIPMTATSIARIGLISTPDKLHTNVRAQVPFLDGVAHRAASQKATAAAATATSAASAFEGQGQGCPGQSSGLCRELTHQPKVQWIAASPCKSLSSYLKCLHAHFDENVHRFSIVAFG